jgi:hypothetical protein
MSVSSVNSGFSPNQTALKSAISQRADKSATLPINDAQSNQAAAAPVEGSTIVSLGAPIPHANKVGVAAYIAIMNPQTAATSMRTEA